MAKEITTTACVISGGSVDALAKRIADGLGGMLIRAEVRVFADGESKLRLREGEIVKGGRAVIVQSLYPPVDTNLLRVLCLISKAREYTQDVTAVIPYMGYARQDSEFLPGEIITMKVLGKLIREAGAAKVVVVDIHSAKGLELLGAEATNVSAVPALARRFAGMRLENPVAISPDKGGSERAGLFASNMGCSLIVLEKSRDRRTGAVNITTKEAGAVRGRDVIIVDDMISTGGSIVKAAEFLKGQNSNRIFVACTHALLVDGAEDKITKAGVEKIVSANTIQDRAGSETVDVSGEIIGALNRQQT